jgi:hypothetical protein
MADSPAPNSFTIANPGDFYVQPDPQNIAAELAACATDKQTLAGELSQVIHRQMLEGMKAIESALPNHKVTGHTDNRLHFALRRQLLSYGNDLKRAIPEMLKAYRVRKVMDREVVTHVGVHVDKTVLREGELQK